MAKTDTSPQSEYATPPAYTDQNALVVALKDLTKAIARRRAASQDAIDAATEYGQIKGALRTHSEAPPNEDAGALRTGKSRTHKG